MNIRRSRIPSEADLAALADGSLPASRRNSVEQAVSESPRLQAAVAAQRRALSAIDHVGDEPAPPSLRARLALAHPPGRARVRLWPAGLVAASVMAVLVAVVVVVITAGGQSRHPTVLQASVLATRPPQASVRSPSGHSQTLPGVTGAGLTYPYLEDQFGYRAVGVRYDRFAGRTATTVLYSRGTSRVAYQIVSGPPLKLGERGWTVWRHGMQFRMLRAPHGQIVTWVRWGHTCVLLGSGTAVPVMLRLASWHDGGRVPY
jgi:anti-sigma factor RsiW